MLHRQRIERQEVDIRVVDDVARVRGFLGRASNCLQLPTSYIAPWSSAVKRSGKRDNSPSLW
jgi:hypothetical protein